jgi:pimeloyl-ACP methyl ester carboxylesterase
MPLDFERRGRGPALVLIHPLGADRRMWAPVLDRLAAERDVVAIDLPGFGGSPSLDAGTVPTPRALAAAVAAELAGVLGAPFHVAGNSLGGWVALELALTGHARSVTAIAPAGLWPEPLMPRRGAARRAARLARPILPALVRSERGRRLALGGSIAHPERLPPRAALALTRAYATAPGFDAVNDAMRAGRFTGLADIRVPTTLAWPEHDRLVARPRRLPARVRNVVLRGCGHLPTWDDPEQVASVLLRGSSDG